MPMPKQFDIRATRNQNWLWFRRELLREHGDELGPYGIATYAALACHAGEGETARPSMSTIADMIGASRRKVQECIRQLHELGWVRYEKRERGDGSDTSHRFYLLSCPTDGCECDAHGGCTACTGGANDVHEGCAQDAHHEVEGNGVEGNEESSGGGSARPRGDSAGDSVPDADDVGVSVSLDFLPEEYSVYQSGIQALLDAYDSDQPDELVKKEWEGARFNFHSVVDLARDHEWRKFVAAVVVTGDQADTPNARYLESLLDSFDTDQPNESDEQRSGRPDDPKQRPADNHERIAAAVASASGE